MKFFNIFPKFVKNTNWNCQVCQILVSFWWQTLAQRKPPFLTGFSCWLLKKFLQCSTVRYSQNCCFWSKCQKSSSMRLKQLKNPDADLMLYFPCLCNIRLINPLKRYFNKINVFCWKFWKLWKTVTPSIFIAGKSYRPFWNACDLIFIKYLYLGPKSYIKITRAILVQRSDFLK